MDTDTIDASSGIGGGDDPEYPDLDSSDDELLGTPAPEMPDDSNEPSFVEQFDVTVGHTLVEEKATGEELVQWKAICGGEQAVSDDPMAAVMGAIAKANGGEVPT